MRNFNELIESSFWDKNKSLKKIIPNHFVPIGIYTTLMMTWVDDAIHFNKSFPNHSYLFLNLNCTFFFVVPQPTAPTNLLFARDLEFDRYELVTRLLAYKPITFRYIRPKYTWSHSHRTIQYHHIPSHLLKSCVWIRSRCLQTRRVWPWIWIHRNTRKCGSYSCCVLNCHVFGNWIQRRTKMRWSLMYFFVSLNPSSEFMLQISSVTASLCSFGTLTILVDLKNIVIFI